MFFLFLYKKSISWFYFDDLKKTKYVLFKKNMMIMFFAKLMENTIWLFCEKHNFADF